MVDIHRRNPHIYLGGRIHRRKLMGEGMGSVIMNVGGAGGGSSYPSVNEYEDTTGRRVVGGSLARFQPHAEKHLSAKLEKLLVKPLNKKPANIKFDM